MTTRASLRDEVAQILTGATAAGGEVYTPADWPTWKSEYPVILVSAPREEKESLGRATVEFTVTATIEIVAKVQAPASARDQGASAAETALENLELQILAVLINNPALTSQLQQFPWIRSSIDFSALGEEHIGELKLEVGMEFYQGPEDFFPPGAVPLTQAAIHLDAINVADDTATFPDPAFPASVTPAPRSSGPDGRDEGALLIDLPQ